MKRLQWPGPPEVRSPHPYRDAALVYAVLAVFVVVLAIVTGGSVARGIFYAVVFFVLATSWSWYSVRRRLREQARR